jgi:hypothetical protein
VLLLLLLRYAQWRCSSAHSSLQLLLAPPPQLTMRQTAPCSCTLAAAAAAAARSNHARHALLHLPPSSSHSCR